MMFQFWHFDKLVWCHSCLRIYIKHKIYRVIFEAYEISSMNYHNRLNARYWTSKLCVARPIVSLPCLSFFLLINHSFSYFGFSTILLETRDKLHVIVLMVRIWNLLSSKGIHLSSCYFACLVADQLLFLMCIFSFYAYINWFF